MFRVGKNVSEEKINFNCDFVFLQFISQNYLVSSWCVLFFALSLHPGSIFLLHPQPGRTKHFLVIDLKSKIDCKLEKINLDTPPWINLQKSGSSRQPLRSEKTHPSPQTIQTWQTVRSDELDELLLDKLFFVQASIPVDIESFEYLLRLFKGRLPRLAL